MDNTHWTGTAFRWLEEQFESQLTPRERMEYWDIVIQSDRGIFSLQPQIDDEDEFHVQEGKKRLKRLFMSMAVDRIMPLTQIYDGIYEQDRHPEVAGIWSWVMDVAGDPDIPTEPKPAWLLDVVRQKKEYEDGRERVQKALMVLWRALVRERTTEELQDRAYDAFKYLKACLPDRDKVNLDLCAGGDSPAEKISGFQRERFLEQFIQLALRFGFGDEVIEEQVYRFQKERGNIVEGAEELFDQKWEKIRKVNNR